MSMASETRGAGAVSARRLGTTFVAQASGVDLSRPLDDDSFAVLRRALLDDYVLSVRGQSLTPEQVLALSRRFGPLEPHVLSQYHHDRHPEILMLSNVIEEGKPKGLADAGSYWHSDVSYKARPSRFSMLHAVEVPAQGGDTLFCDMVAAYEALSDGMKARLGGLRAIHNYAYRQNQQIASHGVRTPLTEAQMRETPSVVHPAIRTHPETGRKAIYVNPGFTVGFEGLDQDESEALKREVFAHCLQDRFQYRYKWTDGDVLIWDNAAVMHYATAAETLRPGQRRTLYRTIISGDAPY